MNGLRIAIPNKGRMSEDIFDLLQRAGLPVSKQCERTLCVTTEDGNYSVIFVRTKDVPKFLHNETCDIGFTGMDIVHESGFELDRVMDFNFGHCKMVVAVKEESPYNSCEEIPDGTKVATSFPNIAKKYFESLGKNVEITEVSGATEITPRLGLAEVIVDITSSGSTLKVNKLKIIGEILQSHAVIVGRPGIVESQKDKIETFVRAINSVMNAEKKKYLMANLPKSALSEIKTFLPGAKAPTITTLLGNDDEVAIHVVIEKSKVYDSVDKLKKLGATGILIMTVDQMIP